MPIYRRSAVLTLAAVLPSILVMAWYGWSPGAPLGPIGTSVIAGAALWAGALHYMDHPLLHEARMLIIHMRLWLASRRAR